MSDRYWPKTVAIAIIGGLLLSSTACAKSPPKTIDGLRGLEIGASLEFVRELEDGPNFSAYLVSYHSSGLKVHAMVAVPQTARPPRGFPVVIANHGHHPDPPNYGITGDGVDSRPGDYYREIPAYFAEFGFLVVMADYRGHSDSEGIEFTDGMLESAYYTEDVVTLLSGLPDIEGADLNNVFMWGHSLGGEVTLRSLLVVDWISGASMWSSVGGDIWDQAYYYSRYDNPEATDSSDVPKRVVDELRRDIAEFRGRFDADDVEPLHYLDYLRTPIVIHHAIGDRGAAYKWSERLAKELYRRSMPYVFYSYPGSDHLFKNDTMREAVERDVAFFRSMMTDQAP